MSLRSLAREFTLSPMKTTRVASLALIVAMPFLHGLARNDPEHATGKGQWRFWGGNLHNTHHAESETLLSPANVGRLKKKWEFKTAGNVSAIPTVVDGTLYITDWGAPFDLAIVTGGGTLRAIDAASGKERWSRRISSYNPNPLNNISRSSPVVHEDLLIFGDVVNQTAVVAGGRKGTGATVYAVNRNNGDLVWKTTLDSHPLAQVTQSPVVHAGRIYVGTSSQEEAAADGRFPGEPYDCCTFQGRMASLDAKTGKILWQTSMAPDNGGKTGGFSGNAIWGSSPAIDVPRKSLYIATSNNYAFPPALSQCLATHRGDALRQQEECYAKLDPENNYADSVVALDLDDGSIRWGQKLRNYGAWVFACDSTILPWLPPDKEACTDIESFDYGFGQAPMLTTVDTPEGPRDIVAVGQKSGVFHAFDPDAGGKLIWRTVVGPGGVQGGMEFGAATDGKRIYAQISNFEHKQFKLTAGPNKGEDVNGGIWAALDAATGALVWQTPDPSSRLPLKGLIVHPVWGGGLGKGFFGVAMGPMTVANGVVFAGSMDQEGHMYALEAETGRILWEFESGGSVMSAPAIVDGVVYWGSGYKTGFNNDKLYAFSIEP